MAKFAAKEGWLARSAPPARPTNKVIGTCTLQCTHTGYQMPGNVFSDGTVGISGRGHPCGGCLRGDEGHTLIRVAG